MVAELVMVLKMMWENIKILIVSKTTMTLILTAVLAPVAVKVCEKFGCDALTVRDFMILGALKVLQLAFSDWGKSAAIIQLPPQS